MATYFHGNNNSNNSEIQSSPEGLQTLYLMNPNYVVPFSSDSNSSHNPTPNSNMLFLNPNNNSTSPTGSTHAHALNLATLSHAPPQHHLLGVSIPPSDIMAPTNATDEISTFHGFPAAGAPRVHYNLWGSIADQTPSSAAASSLASAGHGAADAAGSAAVEIGFRRQGLSLSLSSQQPAYRSFSGEMDGFSPASRGSSVHSVVMGSKYLSATQELLDEVVSVGKGVFSVEGSSNKEKMKGNMNGESNSGVVGDGSSGAENSGANNKQAGGELSTAQRQELQMKKSKLVGMLDEVEQRYRQYHHQMQMVVTSFEQAAGYGAARSYTALALKTISKQFRSLKDTISSQIKATSKALGEDDCLGAKAEGSRLRYVDHHLRQQRALQQLGMIQHNTWRPQRGLPERAVSVLRAWLFEHFLHPYPKDSDKVMLAKQTGLTRSQVSNWFINARVRLWKPMVEEMYTEEIKDQEQNNGSSRQDNTTNRSKEPNNDQMNLLQSKTESSFNNHNTCPTDHVSNSNNSMSQSPMGGAAAASADMDMKPSREANHNSNNIDNKFGIEIRNHGGYGSLISPMEDIGRFNNSVAAVAPRFHGNGVSLTLGLPPSDHHQNLPSQHGFLSQNNMHNLGGGTNENDFCAMNTAPPPPPPPVPSSHSGNSYDHTIDMHNRKRFAAQLLRDFVA